MMQNPVPDWWDNAGWTIESHGQWLNRLGNLCLVTLPQNSSNSNVPFSVKQERMFSGPHGTQMGTVAQSLASHPGPWNLEAVQQQHSVHLQHLADRWKVTGWEGK